MNNRVPKYLNGCYFTPPREGGPAKKKGMLKFPSDPEKLQKFINTLEEMAEWARSTNRRYLKVDIFEGKEGQYGPELDFVRSEYLTQNEIAAGQGEGTPAPMNTQPSGDTTAKVAWGQKDGWDR